MERSIENIWKEGFEAEGNISAPVVSDLYHKKSKLLIDKFRTASKKDNISIIPIAIMLLLGLIFLGKVYLGIYVSILLFSMFFLNKRNLVKLNQISLSSSTYQYLKDYQLRLKEMQKFYIGLLGIGLPILVIPAYLMFFSGAPAMAAFKDLDLVVQITGILVVALVLSGMGILSYRLSTHLIYTKLLTRLDDIIADMEELMQND